MQGRQDIHVQRPRRRNEKMFYLTTHSTHFIYRYTSIKYMIKIPIHSEIRTLLTPLCGLIFPTKYTGIKYMIKIHIYSEIRTLLTPLCGLIFLTIQSFYAPSQRQDNTYHSLRYSSHGTLVGMGMFNNILQYLKQEPFCI